MIRSADIRHGHLLHEVATRLPTKEGGFRIHLFRDGAGKEHLALVKGDVHGAEHVLTRVHSECLTGDLFGSLRCDCGPQLHQAMRMLSEEERGVLVYLRQEGRGIGLAEKLKAYNLQDSGYDTVEANIALGHRAEERDYAAAKSILDALGARSIRLITNNPDKVEKLRRLGMDISGMVRTDPDIGPDNLFYIRTKIERMGHRLEEDLHPFMPETGDLLRYVSRARGPKEAGPFIAVMRLSSLDGRVPSDDRTEAFEILSRRLRGEMEGYVDPEGILHRGGSLTRLQWDASGKGITSLLVEHSIGSVLMDGRSEAAVRAMDEGAVDVLISVIIPAFGGPDPLPTGRMTALVDLHTARMGTETVFYGKPVFAPHPRVALDPQQA